MGWVSGAISENMEHFYKVSWRNMIWEILYHNKLLKTNLQTNGYNV
jgi:hypothetical protein